MPLHLSTLSYGLAALFHQSKTRGAVAYYCQLRAQPLPVDLPQRAQQSLPLPAAEPDAADLADRTLRLLARGDLPAGHPADRSLQQIQKASLRARDLVQQILTFSRQKEQQRLALAPHLIIKEALKLLRATIPTTIASVIDALLPLKPDTAALAGRGGRFGASRGGAGHRHRI